MVVFGVSLFLGLSFPNWVVKNSDLIKTDNESLDQVINALLANNMFMGCFSALVMDNIIPGSDEERGILVWREIPDASDSDSEDSGSNNLYLTLKTYDLPFGMSCIKRLKWGKYIPFLPTFDGFSGSRCPCGSPNKYDPEEEEEVLSEEDINGINGGQNKMAEIILNNKNSPV